MPRSKNSNSNANRPNNKPNKPNKHATLTEAYEGRIAAGQIEDDPAQRAMLAAFENLAADLMARRLPWQKRRPIKGLYLWGGVGRGKTMVMDMALAWFAGNTHLVCRRFHFHDFMTEVHDRIHSPALAGMRDPASMVARLIAEDARVLFFDEMEIRDIADAMIIARVMAGFMKDGGVAVMTSNRHPDDLYKGGLHRERFAPFISLLKAQMTIHEVGGDTDWRRRILGHINGWVEGADADTRPQLEAIFARLCGGEAVSAGHITVAGRRLDFERMTTSVLAVEFADLCLQPLAVRDYLAVAARFAGVVMHAIPPMDDAMQNEARRFIWLVDALYDRGRFLVASSPVDCTQIYTGDLWAAEFPRTASRLVEMTKIDAAGAD